MLLLYKDITFIIKIMELPRNSRVIPPELSHVAILFNIILSPSFISCYISVEKILEHEVMDFIVD